MKKMLLGNTQIWIHQKENLEKDTESYSQILQKVSDIAYQALLCQNHQNRERSDVE